MARYRFSQFDEDLIIQELWGNRGSGRAAEFGARGKRGSNIAALQKEGWFLQLIDRSINETLRDYVVPGMRREPKPYGSVYFGDCNHQIVHATVTPENVNEILAPNLDLLSIDIDGEDINVWRAITQKPEIIIIESNDGPSDGASLLKMGEEKGYRFHARTGVNYVFVSV